MNEFDQWMKHDCKIKNYVRYTDDFIVLADSRSYLEDVLPSIEQFLYDRLALSLHPHKVSIRPFHQGIDFLGYIMFPHFCLLRTRTKKRMLRRLRRYAGTSSLHPSLQSYLGVLSHANAYDLTQYVKNYVWFWGSD